MDAGRGDIGVVLNPQFYVLQTDISFTEISFTEIDTICFQVLLVYLSPFTTLFISLQDFPI